MYNLFLADVNFFERWGLFIAFAVVLVVVITIYYIRDAKERKEIIEIANNLKIGDKIKTYFGLFGVVEKITETTVGKVVTLKTGDNSFADVDIFSIHTFDMKEEIKEMPYTEALPLIKEKASSVNAAQKVAPKSSASVEKTQTEYKKEEEKSMPAAKKPAAKKPAAKKPAVKKAVPAKAAKPVAKKAVPAKAAKPAVKKAAPAKAAKPVAKKAAPAKKAPAKKVVKK